MPDEDKVQNLQDKLYAAAKSDPKRRFHSLRDKVYRRDVLERAWKEVAENRGAPGPNGETIQDIRGKGVVEFLDELHEDLKAGTYKTGPVLRVFIPKASGGTRPLGIPNVRDRVAQAAVKLVIEPIFEADFKSFSYGYRPNKSAVEASKEVNKWLNFGKEYVLDADIEHCFDEIPHGKLMKAVARRISDGYILKLIKMWLSAPVLINGTLHKVKKGTPQGGVISPLLANIYLHQIDDEWERRGMNNGFGPDGQLVRYADDIVVLSKKPVDKVARTLCWILADLGLQLSEKKTRIVKAEEGFDFLGFRFIRRYSRKYRKRRTYYFPSPESVKRIKETIREYAGNNMRHVIPVDVVRKLNSAVKGWRNYYRHSHATTAFGIVRRYLAVRFVRFLRRRKSKSGIGRYRDHSDVELIEKYGLALRHGTATRIR